MSFYPLPTGLRDALPEEARAEEALVRELLATFARAGFERVITPMFEFAEVLELGLGRRALANMLTFVEPESGEIAALRPDITPQIARLVATRLSRRARPLRISYEGTVARRRAGRARRQRQIRQVGAELVGQPGRDGDLAMIETLGAALHAVGLAKSTLDLTDAGIVHALIGDVGSEQASEIGAALAVKDEAAVRSAARGTGREATLAALTHLSGGPAALDEARATLAGGPASPYVDRLTALHDAVLRLGIFDVVLVDIGEVRELDYYTGCMFHVFADGPGAPIAGGGRYDTLLARFGVDAPAVGFALDLENLAWARRRAGLENLLAGDP